MNPVDAKHSRGGYVAPPVEAKVVAPPAEPKRGIVRAIAAKVVADDELAAQRLAICRACEFRRTTPYEHCGKCGCVLRWKSKVKSGTCPVGKW